MELDKSSAALAYRQNPTAHPEYVSQVFTDMNQCIERKGWKQVRCSSSKSKSRCIKRSHPNWLKQVSQRHAQIPRPQKPLHGRSKIDSRVCQVRRVDEKFEAEAQNSFTRTSQTRSPGDVQWGSR